MCTVMLRDIRNIIIYNSPPIEYAMSIKKQVSQTPPPASLSTSIVQSRTYTNNKNKNIVLMFSLNKLRIGKQMICAY
jgi:hypothetical protein